MYINVRVAGICQRKMVSSGAIFVVIFAICNACSADSSEDINVEKVLMECLNANGLTSGK